MASTNKEDYLRAMYHFAERHDEIRSVDLAEYLGVSKPSVSEMVRTLQKDGLVKYEPYGSIQLSKKGVHYAQNLTARHRLIEKFLHDVLKINPKHIHDEAHKLEHAFSDESIMKIKKMLDNPKQDPHGSVIPAFVKGR